MTVSVARFQATHFCISPRESLSSTGLRPDAGVFVVSCSAETSVAVSELVPPAVATGLAGPDHAHGADVDKFCDSVFSRLEKREPVVGFGPTDTPDFHDRLHAEHERFLVGAQRFPTARF
ncbi:hypothetical protein [Gordonia otitidis]|uniref:Uncharacterized protein n=1 Tax=Gordonia otitidis (strain DSM 44809 / CCUG 52243 / JCM 12355 / NBRC 100426 / IFM 10032) TaxID=1108044 RepID=H5TLC3_GORO1|nr:hypothetical protein [Gordonia otitidis]GAB34281.1 hypothetical protein GOOTI_100_00030 [Gordonia otitidis NBRC 100426]